jgi:hypothetical protein
VASRVLARLLIDGGELHGIVALVRTRNDQQVVGFKQADQSCMAIGGRRKCRIGAFEILAERGDVDLAFGGGICQQCDSLDYKPWAPLDRYGCWLPFQLCTA